MYRICCPCCYKRTVQKRAQDEERRKSLAVDPSRRISRKSVAGEPGEYGTIMQLTNATVVAEPPPMFARYMLRKSVDRLNTEVNPIASPSFLSTRLFFVFSFVLLANFDHVWKKSKIRDTRKWSKPNETAEEIFSMNSCETVGCNVFRFFFSYFSPKRFFSSIFSSVRLFLHFFSFFCSLSSWTELCCAFSHRTKGKNNLLFSQLLFSNTITANVLLFFSSLHCSFYFVFIWSSRHCLLKNFNFFGNSIVVVLAFLSSLALVTSDNDRFCFLRLVRIYLLTKNIAIFLFIMCVES